MTRTILTAALLLGTTFVAHADTNIWSDMSRQHRSDYELRSDTRYCRHETGPDLNGVPTSSAMKSCMRAQGWRFRYTRIDDTSWRHPSGCGCRYGYRHAYGYPSTARQD